jgi:ammonium transporter Rh
LIGLQQFLFRVLVVIKMKPTELTTLLPTSEAGSTVSPAMASGSLVSTIFITIQAVLLSFFLVGTKYSDKDYDVKEYIAFRDIMTMLLLGFGYLMTFLKTYGLGAVGFTMMLSILSMELNIAVELFVRFLSYGSGEDTSFPVPISIATLIDAEFAAATLMITFGALIGRASPVQMLVVCVSQSIFYALNKVVFVLGVIHAEDVGGSMTIHMFGAYFGLAASYALGGAKDDGASEAGTPDKVSDVSALIGTTILWVFWPSFVGATETGVPLNEYHCMMNTILSLLASTTVTFYLSQKLCHGKFDPIHIANSTLAGGVAIGCAGRLNIGPGAAIITGALAGTSSVYGYVYSTPYLESKYGIFDTCGVANLHGYPSVVGALLSIFFIALDPDAEFLTSEVIPQMLRQLGGIIATLIISIASGYGTGVLASSLKDDLTPSFQDEVWWHLEY